MKLESLVSWLVFVGTVGSSVFNAYWVMSIIPALDVRTWLSSPFGRVMPCALSFNILFSVPVASSISITGLSFISADILEYF
jgi:hypothetical protein|nr:MAG TPA: hypothetical protein [Caudoviricetes sp.]